MIAHFSVPARNPRETALLFARLIDGVVFSFPVVAGAWIAVARDNSGLAVEIYPEAMAHHPGEGEAPPNFTPQGPQSLPWEDQIYPEGSQLRPSAFHAAITSPLSEEEIIAVANKAGVRTVVCDRGGVFKLVEVWIDGAVLIEVLSASEAARYRAFMTPAGAAAMFGEPIAA